MENLELRLELYQHNHGGRPTPELVSESSLYRSAPKAMKNDFGDITGLYVGIAQEADARLSTYFLQREFGFDLSRRVQSGNVGHVEYHVFSVDAESKVELKGVLLDRPYHDDEPTTNPHEWKWMPFTNEQYTNLLNLRRGMVEQLGGTVGYHDSTMDRKKR